MIVTVTLNTAIDRTLALPSRPVGAVVKARIVRLIPDGKGVNVSMSLAHLGVPSTATGFVGQSELDAYRRFLGAAGVRCRLLPLPVRTRMNTTILWSKPSPGELHVRETGDTLPRSAFPAIAKLLKRLSSPRTVFVFSGSTPPGLSLAGYVRLLRIARSGGAFVCADTSGPFLAAAAKARVNFMKPNEEELAELTSMPVDSVPQVLAAARSLLKRVDTVLVSRGAKGAILVSPEGAWTASASLPKGRPVNSVGAGDASIAGFLMARALRHSLPVCLASAVAGGAANALEPSAGALNPAIFRKLLSKVSLSAL